MRTKLCDNTKYCCKKKNKQGVLRSIAFFYTLTLLYRELDHKAIITLKEFLMEALSKQNGNIRINLPQSGLTLATYIVFGFMMLIGAFAALIVVQGLLGSGFGADVIKEMENDDFPALAFFLIFASTFLALPLGIILSGNSKKEKQIKPFAFVFNNHNREFEIYEDEESRRPESSIPYDSIDSFFLDTYVVSSGRSSTRYYFVGMKKRDGALWELLQDRNESRVRAWLNEIQSGVSLDSGRPSPESSNSAAPANCLIKRDYVNGLVTYRWKLQTNPFAMIFSIMILAAFTVMIAHFILDDPNDTGFIIAFVIFLGVFWIILGIGAVLTVRNLLGDQAIRVDPQGLSTGMILPRTTGKFKSSNTIPYKSIAAVRYGWSARSSSYNSQLFILKHEAMASPFSNSNDMVSGIESKFKSTGRVDIASIIAMAQASTPISVTGLRICDVLWLEGSLERDVRQHGGVAE
jgi:hypothetical protein